MTVEKEGRVRAAVVLTALVALSTGLRFWAGYRVPGLWIAPDEMIYGTLGESLWRSGELRIFGGPPAVYSVVYPALVGPWLVFLSLDAGYVALKAFQALVMSLMAVPVYLWARRLTTSGWALAAAALTLALPGLVYAGLIMTEVAFVPALVLAAWATAAALERPSGVRQALLVGAIVLAVATRLQALVLVPALVTAAGLHALLARDSRPALRLWPAAAALVTLGAAWAGWRAAASGSWSGLLGSYSAAAERDYELGEAAGFVLYHLGDALLLTGVVPLCAVVLLVLRRDRPPALDAYLATALSLTAWLVVEVGVFASENVGALAERDLIGLAPVLFVGFVAWLGRGVPRPRPATDVVALATLGVLLVLPLERFVVQAAVPDSLTLVPLLWLREQYSVETLQLAFWIGAAVLLALLALAPRRAALALPVLAAGFLVFGSVAASREVAQNSAFDQSYYLGGKRAWVDAVAGEPVGYLYAGERYWNGVWQTLFWNDRVRRVYFLEGVRLPPGLPATTVTITPSGRLVQPDGSSVPERFLIASNALELWGRPAASIEQRFIEQSGLTLWRLEPPARLSSIRTGVRPDGDMYEPGRMRVHDCQGGQLELTLLPKSSSRVELRANGRVQRVLHLQGEAFLNATIHPPPGAQVCRFEVVPDNLLGSTRFDFVRR